MTDDQLFLQLVLTRASHNIFDEARFRLMEVNWSPSHEKGERISVLTIASVFPVSSELVVPISCTHTHTHIRTFLACGQGVIETDFINNRFWKTTPPMRRLSCLELEYVMGAAGGEVGSM